MGTERCGKNGLKVERCSDLSLDLSSDLFSDFSSYFVPISVQVFSSPFLFCRHSLLFFRWLELTYSLLQKGVNLEKSFFLQINQDFVLKQLRIT